MDALHNIKAVSMRTGLSAHVIRAWEKRYAAVTPSRTEGGRRVYFENDVQRLALMGTLTQRGFAISQVAQLAVEELSLLVDPRGGGAVALAGHEVDIAADVAGWIMQVLESIRKFDTDGLTTILDQALVQVGASGLLERLLIQLLQRLGELWAAGNLTASQEHFFSAALRDYLTLRVQGMATAASAPRVVVGTPMGQLHELGAVICAALARKSGWLVTYLGPGLPAEELVHACVANRCRALALSIIYPLDDPLLQADLLLLEKLLPAGIQLILGGPDLRYYQASLTPSKSLVVQQMAEFTPLLASLRSLS
jgi:MerR family transcriptional regulator, light-induced transcriptional regulator